MLHVKVYICCETLSNRIRIERDAFKNQQHWTPLLIAGGCHRKTIKLKKALCAKCPPVIGIAKGVVMDHKNRCLLVRQGDQ